MSPPAQDQPEDGRAAPPWPFVVEATCDDASLFFFLDIAHVQSLLPAGFVAADADAADWLVPGGSPSPLGQGVASVTVADCDGSSLPEGPYAEAGVAVLVEPPAIEGAAVHGDPLASVYFAGLFVTSLAYMERLAPWGHDIVRASVAGRVADPPQAGPMAITIRNADGEVARCIAALPGYDPLGAV